MTRHAPYPGLSVVVPAYRSPGTLARLCAELAEHVVPLVESLEVIFVDDGSNDGTWQSISELSTTHHWVRGLTLLRNYGQHNALLAGLREAAEPLVLTMDDDLQNPPDQVPALLAALTDDVDLVYGRPVTERQSRSRNAASRLTKRAMAVGFGSDVHPHLSAFRLFRRELVAATGAATDPSISIDVLLSWATTRVVDVPVEFQQRVAGRSGYSISRLIRHALTMITGYSTRPLRWVSAMGLLISLFGFLLLLYVLGSYLTYGRQVEGFTFVAAAVSLFSGVQLLSLGVVGEYIGRIHLRSMGRPAYLVRATTGSPAGVGRDDAVGEAISVVEAVPGAVRAAEAVPVVSAGP